MGDHSKIEWTDASWNPIRGCQKVSPGCKHCYAEVTAGRFCGPGEAYEGTARLTKAGARWTGVLREVPEHLYDPLAWRRPRLVFVNSMSDLFWEKVSRDLIVDVYAVMHLAHWHTFQILTKRSARMRELLSEDSFPRDVRERVERHAAIEKIKAKDVPAFVWPLPNVWQGVSIETQEYMHRAVDLCFTPAAVRWVSAEPLLGPLDFRGFKLDWIVVGGESGAHARPMLPSWARSIRDWCREHGTPFFFKQWGGWAPTKWRESFEGISTVSTPEGELLVQMGKKAAGRVLDGREWDEYPKGAGQRAA